MQVPAAPIRRGLLWLLFVIYMALLVKLVLFKYPHGAEVLFGNTDHAALGLRIQFSNFTPFKTIAYYMSGHTNTRTALENLAGNVLLFVPFGLLLPSLRRNLQAPGLIAITSFLLSLAFEVVQLLTGIGAFDVDDLLLNVAGGMCGWLIYRGLRWLLARRGR